MEFFQKNKTYMEALQNPWKILTDLLKKSNCLEDNLNFSHFLKK